MDNTQTSEKNNSVWQIFSLKSESNLWIYKLNTIPIKILAAFFCVCFFCRNYKLILKFIWKCKGPIITRTI